MTTYFENKLLEEVRKLASRLDLFEEALRHLQDGRVFDNLTPSGFLSVANAAEYLGVSRWTLQRWSKLGKITRYRLPNGKTHLKKSDLDEILVRVEHPRVRKV